MLIKIQKEKIEKLVQCDGYDRMRYAFHEGDSDHTQLGLDEPTPKEFDGTYTMLEFRGNDHFGAHVIPEKPGNRVFVMNDAGDTIDRWVWG